MDFCKTFRADFGTGQQTTFPLQTFVLFCFLFFFCFCFFVFFLIDSQNIHHFGCEYLLDKSNKLTMNDEGKKGTPSSLWANWGRSTKCINATVFHLFNVTPKYVFQTCPHVRSMPCKRANPFQVCVCVCVCLFVFVVVVVVFLVLVLFFVFVLFCFVLILRSARDYQFLLHCVT